MWSSKLTQKDPLPAICYWLLHLRYLSQIEDIYYLDIKDQQEGDDIEQKVESKKKNKATESEMNFSQSLARGMSHNL